MAEAGAKITSLSISVDANTGKAATKIEKVAEALRSLNAALSSSAGGALNELLSGISGLAGTSANVHQLSESIKRVSSAAIGASKSVDTFGKKIVELSTNITTATEQTDNFANSVKNLGDASQNVALPIVDRDYTVILSEMNARLEALQNASTAVISKLGNVSRSASKTAESTRGAALSVRSLKTAFKELSSNALTKAANMAKKAISSLAGSFKNLFKSSGKGVGGIEKLFKSIGRIAFYRAIRTMMKSITQGLKEGIKNLYYYSELIGTRFKPSMDKIATSALFIKNAFAAMAAPLINVVAPILDRIGDKIAGLANKMAEFFSALTGQNVYTRAIKYAQEYNDELDETAKRLERWLAPFDEINRMNDNSGSGNANAIDYSRMFEEAVVSSEMSEIARKIIEAFENVDLTPIGRALGEKIKNMMDSLNWDSIKEKAANIATRIVTFINGGLSVDGFGASVGRTIAEGLNTAVTFASTLVSKLNWKKLGKQVGESLREFIRTFGFEDVGTGINSLAGGILDGLQAAVDSISKIDPATGLSGWDEFGKKIAKALSEIKFSKILGKTITIGVNIVGGILQSVVTFLKETETNGFWDELGEDIGNALANIDWIGLIGRIGEIGVNILKGVFKSIKTAIKTGFNVDDDTAGFIVDAAAVGLLTGKIAKLLSGTKSLTGAFGSKNKALSQQTQLTGEETSAATEMGGAFGRVASLAIPALVGGLVSIFNGLGKTKDEATNAGAVISSAFGGAMNSVQQAAGAATNSLAPLNNAMTTTIPGAVKTMSGAIDQHLTWARNNVQKTSQVFNSIPASIKGMTDNIAGNLEISAKNEESYVRIESENWRKYNQTRVDQTIEAAQKIRATNNALPSGGAFPASVVFGAVGIGMLGGLGRGRAFSVGGMEYSLHDSGGYPSAGSLFIAGEGRHSPEYVGSFGGQTGVWNSDQLVQAMYTALSSALANNPQGGDIYLDGEAIYRSVVNHNNTHVRSTGRAALLT